LLVGGALPGMIGALMAIPIGAIIKLVLDEVSYPRLEES
jgi:predicted PurR-regulated permease PerM